MWYEWLRCHLFLWLLGNIILDFLRIWYVYFQSHISENPEEVKLVKELFPEADSYTDVYYKHNLLTDKVRMPKMY